MKYCRVVSTLFILVLTISVVWGKHKGRRSKDHLRHKHMRLLTHAKFFRHPDNYSTLAHSNHRHERGKLIGDAIDFHFLFVRQRWDLICIWLRFCLCKRKIWKFGTASGVIQQRVMDTFLKKLKYFSKSKIISYHGELNFNNDNILNMKKKKWNRVKLQIILSWIRRVCASYACWTREDQDKAVKTSYTPYCDADLSQGISRSLPVLWTQEDLEPADQFVSWIGSCTASNPCGAHSNFIEKSVRQNKITKYYFTGN